MSQGSKNFNETLARGLAFEQGQAIKILHQLYPQRYIMNNQIDPSASTGGKIVGPRLYRGEHREEEVILPDFTLFHPHEGHSMWVDAKLKGASYPYKGRQYFTIDRHKHQQYCAFPDWIKGNFWLLFKHEKTEAVYFTRFNENPETIYFDNKYGKGDTPVYFLEHLAKVG